MSDNHEIDENLKPLRHPKTKKGRKIQENRKAKILEDPRQTLFIRGPKSSDQLRNFMHEMHQLKKDNSILFSRKHELRPMEDQEALERFCEQNDCSQFCFFSNSKKRPNNVVIGRTFNGKILDMVELGLLEFNSIDQFVRSLDVPIHSRPTLIFQGEVFGYHRTFMKIHNIFTDFFVENIETELMNPNKLNLIIYITGSEENLTLTLTVYQRIHQYENGELLVKINEIGPKCSFQVRREQFADDDTFKKACKQPKPKKKHQDKNVKYDKVGDKRGRVFVQQQDITTLDIKRRKKLRKGLDKNRKIAENQVEKQIEIQVEDLQQ